MVWDFDKPNRKLRPHKVNMGSLRRNAEYITVDDNVSAPSAPPVPSPRIFPILGSRPAKTNVLGKIFGFDPRDHPR